MRAAVIEQPGVVCVTDLPEPHAGPGEVVVKVAACGVCGTDVHLFCGGFRGEYPLVPGHEFCGTVAEVGDEVHHVAPGDRVVVDPNIVCGVCAYCRRGLVHLCQNLGAVGVTRPGGFAEYCLVPASQLHRWPDHLHPFHAALVEPLACCLHGLDRAEVQAGETVVVLGAGPIGLMMAQLVRLAGAARVVVSEPSAAKRERASQLGAHATFDPLACDLPAEVMALTEIGADVVIECAGRPETVAQALTLVRRGGRVLLFGVNPKDASVAIRPYDVFLNELTIAGSYINPFTHSRAIELLAAGRLNAMALISHRLPLERFEEALQTAGSDGAVKVMVSVG